MSDLEQLKITFKVLGIPFTHETNISAPTKLIKELFAATQSLTIQEGLGYCSFVGIFYFNKDGKFLNYGLWE